MKKEKIVSLPNVKFIIDELSRIQDEYYDDVIKNCGVKSSMEDWVFDWLFNSDKSLDEYLNIHNIKREDIFNE